MRALAQIYRPQGREEICSASILGKDGIAEGTPPLRPDFPAVAARLAVLEEKAVSPLLANLPPKVQKTTPPAILADFFPKNLVYQDRLNYRFFCSSTQKSG